MTTEDYYSLLGVSRDATKDQIRKRYREIVKTLHPDLVGKGKEEEFKRVSEAYEVLSDDKLRERYDQYGKAGVQQEFGTGGFDWSKFTHLNDIFDLFGLRGAQGSNGFSDEFAQMFRGGGSSRASMLEANLSFNLTVTIAESLVETPLSKEITYQRQDRCADCAGQGGTGSKQRCKECGGKGIQTRTVGQGIFRFASQEPCGHCQGTGQLYQSPCRTCDGNGTLKVRTTVRIDDLRKYVNQVIVFRSNGNYVPDQGYGSLEIMVLVQSDPYFQVLNKCDLVYHGTVDIFTALLGGTLSVPNPANPERSMLLEIGPVGDLNDIRTKVSNQGLYQDRSLKKRGNLYLILRLARPALSPTERSELETLRMKRGA